MNRLFILGNGFDLNLGLPTSYKYFYRYYIAKKTSSGNLMKMKENIKQYEDSDWKDLELGIGKYTKEINGFDALEECCIDLNTNLSTFLSVIDNFKYPFSEKLKEQIRKDLAHPEAYLTKAERITMSRFTSNLSSSGSNDVVTFNYTHTLENMLGKDQDVVKSILHIHRELGESGLLLGVDSLEQISKEEFRSDEAAVNLLVKPIMNKSLGSLNDDAFENLIKSANLICLFGVSMGDTHTVWWKRIGNRLVNTDQCRVIYFVKTNKVFKIDQQKINYKMKCKQQFLEALHVDKKFDTKGILSRIDVVLDSSIFVDETISHDFEKMYALTFEQKFI